MSTPIACRWLGVAGIELTVEGQVLAVDPYFSRVPLHRMLGRLRPDPALVAEKMPRCDVVLVTHAHFDHLLDVPDLVRNSGALALGSAHTCRLLRALGIPPVRIHEIRAGDRLALGNFQVEVLPGEHGRILGRPVYTGELPRRLRPPLRAGDYRLDCCFGFLVECAGRRLLHWGSERATGAVPADVLFLGPHRPPELYEPLLRAVRPRLVIPIHWDDFFRPLARPLRPMLEPPRWAWPPLRSMDPERFGRLIEGLAPGACTFIPEVLRSCDLGEILSRG